MQVCVCRYVCVCRCVGVCVRVCIVFLLLLAVLCDPVGMNMLYIFAYTMCEYIYIHIKLIIYLYKYVSE